MRGLFHVAAAISLAAGCATAPPAADHAASAPASVGDAASRPAHPGRIAAVCPGDAMLKPTRVAGLFGGCAETQAELEAVKADLANLEAALGALETDFKEVTLGWTKSALYNLSYYKKCAQPSSRNCLRQDEANRDTIVESKTYNRATIEAVKEFQKVLHPENNSAVTGWITFPEARNLICRAGRKQKDDTAILLAGWLARGEVYAQNLPRAYWVIDGFIGKVDGIVAEQETGQRKDYFRGLKREAEQLRDYIVVLNSALDDEDDPTASADLAQTELWPMSMTDDRAICDPDKLFP